MRFPNSFLDEIRARLPASAVVGRKVKLRKQGREFAGLSPFNAEKTASFFVNDTKGKWFDFSAGKNGDIFTFVMETEGLSFPEAVERLAGEAGVPMPARDAQAEEREKERATLHDVLELATQFFEAALNARTGAAARGYLTGRDIGPDLQRQFRLGYAPADRSALKEHLSGKGITQEQMIAAGLLVSGPDIPVSFDRFRERVIFPITDFRGRIVAFGGRALSRRRAGEVSQLAGDRALPQGACCSITAPMPATPPAMPARWWWSRAMSTSSAWWRRASPTPWRRSAPRSPTASSTSSGAWPTSRSSASTATRRACAPPTAPPISLCRS